MMFESNHQTKRYVHSEPREAEDGNKSVHNVWTALGINVTVQTKRRRNTCVYLIFPLICSASLLLHIWISDKTPTYRYFLRTNITSYHQPNNKSLQFDHQPKNNSSQLDDQPKNNSSQLDDQPKIKSSQLDHQPKNKSSNLNYKPEHLFDHFFPLDEPLTCFNGSRHPRPVFLLVLIASCISNYERRQAIRETWGSPKEIMGKKIITVFLLGSGTPKLQDLQKERSTHHDILQADFLDTYKNLTIKTIMGMKWIHTYCSHASYFMKTDDDMYISYANIIKKLSAPSTPSTDFAMGCLFPNGVVIRSKSNKFYMPESMFPDPTYPPYLAGSGYVMSGDLASKIYRVSRDVRYVYFEDVFVGLCLQALKVVPIGHSGFTYSYTHINYEVCEYRNHRMSSHQVKPKEMHRIWNDLKVNSKQC